MLSMVPVGRMRALVVLVMALVLVDYAGSVAQMPRAPLPPPTLPPPVLSLEHPASPGLRHAVQAHLSAAAALKSAAASLRGEAGRMAAGADLSAEPAAGPVPGFGAGPAGAPFAAPLGQVVAVAAPPAAVPFGSWGAVPPTTTAPPLVHSASAAAPGAAPAAAPAMAPSGAPALARLPPPPKGAPVLPVTNDAMPPLEAWGASAAGVGSAPLPPGVTLAPPPAGGGERAGV